jgi:hypothetical protein
LRIIFVGLSADLVISFVGIGASGLMKCATYAPRRVGITCAFQRGKLFLTSFLVTGYPMETEAPGAEEAMN